MAEHTEPRSSGEMAKHNEPKYAGEMVKYSEPKCSEELEIHSGLKSSEEMMKNSKPSSGEVPVVQVEDLSIEVNALLGKGGFGEVFKGNWLGMQVAVKMISISRMQMVTPLINKEVSLLSCLRHPHIVQLLM